VHALPNTLNKKAEGLLEPLLEGDEDDSSASSDESSLYSSSTVSIQVKPTAMQWIKTAVVTLGLGAGVAASAASIVFAPVVAVIVMASVLFANVPYAAYKEVRIIKLPALRALNNMLRHDAENLEAEVSILTEEIDDLQPEAARATVVEAELRSIAQEQHGNVDKLVNLVKENEAILTEMRDNLRQRIVQDIIKIVMLSDKNNDGRFCKVETKMLVLKISLQLQEYGVEFDEAKFYKVMSVDPTVTRTLTIVKRLVPSLNDDEDSLSSGEDEDEENDAYDMFHMTEGGMGGSLASSMGGLSIDGPRRLSLSIERPKRRTSLSLSKASSRGNRRRSKAKGASAPGTPMSGKSDNPVYTPPPPPSASSPMVRQDGVRVRRNKRIPGERKRDYIKRILDV